MRNVESAEIKTSHLHRGETNVSDDLKRGTDAVYAKLESASNVCMESSVSRSLSWRFKGPPLGSLSRERKGWCYGCVLAPPVSSSRHQMWLCGFGTANYPWSSSTTMKNSYSSKYVWDVQKSECWEPIIPGSDLFVFRSCSFTAGIMVFSFLLSQHRNLGSSLPSPSSCSVISDQANGQFNLTYLLKQTSPL